MIERTPANGQGACLCVVNAGKIRAYGTRMLR